MNQKQTEQVVTTVATLATVIDAASNVVNELLGDVISGKVNDVSLGSVNTIELVAARVSAHITADLN